MNVNVNMRFTFFMCIVEMKKYTYVKTKKKEYWKNVISF